MKKAVVAQIDNLIDEGSEITDDWQILRWSNKVAVFLRTTLGENLASDFSTLDSDNDWDVLAMQLGLLQGISAKMRDDAEKSTSAKQKKNSPQQNSVTVTPSETRKVFVVHGHDEAAKEATARFLEKLDMQPIILHEQANSGRTIIEKFEKYSEDVGFSVVLLTPDDLGTAQKDPEKLKSRARQNVVLELGYFLGKLSRNRVCALHKGDVELPSDIQGVIYIEMDNNGAWKSKLAQELVQAKYTINLEGLLSG